MNQFTMGSYLAKIKTSRAAVVPYLILYNRLYFLLARDQISGDITDLGGGVKQDEYSLTAAIREFREESDEIFGTIYDNINELAANIALLGDTMSVLFIPVSIDWYVDAPILFEKKKNDKFQKRSHNEVSELIWIDEDKFREMITPKNTEMWSRVKRFYRRYYTDNFKKALKMVYTY